MIAGDRIKVAARRQSLVGPERMIPSASYQPFARCGRFGACGNALLHLVERLAADQVDIELFKTAGGEMGVRIIESGHHKAPVQVDHLRALCFQLLYFRIGANGNDLAAQHGNGLDPFCQPCRIEILRPGNVIRNVGRAYINIAVDEDHLRRIFDLRRGKTCHCEHHQHSRENFHSCTPVSASRASRIRFNPRSRLLQSNHSRSVCAPPPSPPEPMVMASFPAASGMLASVEASRGTDLILRWASTARITCTMRAFCGSSAAGRSPMLSTATLIFCPLAGDEACL